jgi:malonate transporter and related proteins
MSAFVDRLAAASPLFVLIFFGYAIARWGDWPRNVSDALTRFVFALALPALLFGLMSDLSSLPPVDARLLIAFFGGCLIVFVIGRLVARFVFHLDGVSGSVFALGGIFSNNLLLGLPLAKATLGDASLPTVALVLVFNSLILWTLVTVSVEWARHGAFSVRGFARTTLSVLRNPIVASILSGTAFGLTGWPLPHLVAEPLDMVAQAATPMALVVLGMGLSEYGVREGVKMSLTVCAFKLVILPLVVWGLAWLLGLPRLETQVVVLMSSVATGANVYLMSRQFQALEGPTAASLVLSTALAALTTPILMTLIM